jgi:hypothetical protein
MSAPEAFAAVLLSVTLKRLIYYSSLRRRSLSFMPGGRIIENVVQHECTTSNYHDRTDHRFTPFPWDLRNQIPAATDRANLMPMAFRACYFGWLPRHLTNASHSQSANRAA